MPVTPTYPGVYIEELPSGVRTITGVATSITAFVGRALFGPVNEPVRIQSFGDFERRFGGLWEESTLSYAVQQFFLNGGADALIVRLVNMESSASISLDAGTDSLELEAVELGESGAALRATVDYTSVTGEGVTDDHFNLTIFRVDEGGTAVAGSEQVFSDITIGEVVSELAVDTSPVRVSATSSAALPANRLDVVTSAAFTANSPMSGKAAISLPVQGENPMILEAANEGSWGNNLRVFIDHDTAIASSTTQFNLTVEYFVDNQVQSSEIFRNLELATDSRRFVGDVLGLESGLARLRIDGDTPTAGRPNETVDTDGEPEAVSVTTDGSDGTSLLDGLYTDSRSEKRGIYALEKADLFNLLCLPPITRATDIDPATWIEALAYCHARRAMLIVDPPSGWRTNDAATTNLNNFLNGWSHQENAALFFPRVRMADPLKENRLAEFAACGAVAGIMARTDVNRGVWKAPAGIDATITGARELTVKLTDGENGQLNPLGVNCLRTFPVYGNVVWGARTLAGDDRLASEWKYVPVRRLALFLEESLFRGTQWVVFEPNDEPLWAQIRLNLGAFMQGLFRQGAFQGSTPKEAYFVKCDKETTTQNDINLGIVNIVVGFAPLKPAEFVIIKFQQIAGALEA